ncbi:MAG: FHA domain-containing protein [Pseudomonadota bacterium]
MLSKKIEPQSPEEAEFDFQRDALDDAGQVQEGRVRGTSASQPIVAKPEEPEVAGSGWAQDGDWDDDWDDDEDWGVEDDPMAQMEARRRTEDKEHLVDEIRDAMTSVSHAPAVEAPMPAAPQRKEWDADADFGRQARARSQLEQDADDAGDRLLEKTEDVMSDRETSRRRSAMAHMKAAAAATKADRVLREVASHDGATDPEEQSPYRDDLAKVVRPHSASRPISRTHVSADAPTPVWDHGAGDDDAALFAASESGQDDRAYMIDSEMTAAEELRLARAPTELSEEDFAADDQEFARARAARDFPSSRFATPAEEAGDEVGDVDDFEHAAEDIAEQSRANNEFDDPFADEGVADDFDVGFEPVPEVDDDGPRQSSAVAEALAIATAPDEEFEQMMDDEPEHIEPRKKIWEMADEVAAQVEHARADASPDHDEDNEPENLFEVSTAAIAGRAGRSAGRVKTRLLGFQADEDAKDLFAAHTPGAAPVVADRFPTGWIVVIEGPGRGASFSLHAGVSQIGRGEDQSVRLDFGDTSISRNNHAAIAFDEEQGKFFLGHGGKSNLVRLNGQPVLSTEEMSDGDEIRIGETCLKLVALCGDQFTWNEDGVRGEDA